MRWNIPSVLGKPVSLMIRGDKYTTEREFRTNPNNGADVFVKEQGLGASFTVFSRINLEVWHEVYTRQGVMRLEQIENQSFRQSLKISGTVSGIRLSGKLTADAHRGASNQYNELKLLLDIRIPLSINSLRIYNDSSWKRVKGEAAPTWATRVYIENRFSF